MDVTSPSSGSRRRLLAGKQLLRQGLPLSILYIPEDTISLKDTGQRGVRRVKRCRGTLHPVPFTSLTRPLRLEHPTSKDQEALLQKWGCYEQTGEAGPRLSTSNQS